MKEYKIFISYVIPSVLAFALSGIYAIRKTFQFSERLRIIFANQEKEEKKVGILWQIK